MSHLSVQDRRFGLLAVMLAGFAACAVSFPSMAYPGQKLERQAKVSIAKARQIALAARPGSIVDEELEREPGGTGLRYTFGVRSEGVLYEVGVDAASGVVLENQAEGANPD